MVPRPSLFLIVALTFFTSITHARMHTTFDLGGVLVGTNSSKAFAQVGYGAFIWFSLANLSKLLALRNHVRYTLVYPFLASLEQVPASMPTSYDPEGKPLPFIMTRYQNGAYASSALRTTIEEELARNLLLAPSEKQIIRAVTTMMFTPTKFVETAELLPGAFELVKECKERGDILSIHSVWDKESFELLKKKHPEFFALFDHIFISGDLGYSKPAPQSYARVLEGLGLTTATAYQNTFIDDLACNVEAAQAQGIFGVLCPSINGTPQYQSVREHLHARRLEVTNRQILESLHAPTAPDSHAYNYARYSTLS